MNFPMVYNYQEEKCLRNEAWCETKPIASLRFACIRKLLKKKSEKKKCCTNWMTIIKDLLWYSHTLLEIEYILNSQVYFTIYNTCNWIKYSQVYQLLTNYVNGDLSGVGADIYSLVEELLRWQRIPLT